TKLPPKRVCTFGALRSRRRMTVSDPPVLGWSVWTIGSAPKSLDTINCVSVALGPAPRPQPLAAAASAAAAIGETTARARARLSNRDHHPRRAARQLGGLVPRLVGHVDVEHVAAAAELGRQQVAPVRLVPHREPDAVRGAALLDGLELLGL